MKKFNYQTLILALLVAASGIYSCQKESVKTNEGPELTNNAVSDRECGDCVERWEDSEVDILLWEIQQISAEVYNDADGIHVRVYKVGGTYSSLRWSTGPCTGNLTATPHCQAADGITECSFTIPYTDGWEACDIVTAYVRVTGGGVAGDQYRCIEYQLREICEVEEVCYKTESALSFGPRYEGTNNWFTYTPYEGVAKTLDIFAGQNILVGTASFSIPDIDNNVTITVALSAPWQFQPVADNVKIHGYETTPTWLEPKLGQFAYKAQSAMSTYSRTVPNSNFYGVHLDVRKVVDCPEPE